MHDQPTALKTLIFTEMTEVYGYFSLQAILVFYMIKALAFSDAQAYEFAGQFVAFAYLMPVLGGWVADRYLGHRMAILSGIFCLCLGYFLLFLNQAAFFYGLTLVIMGTGLFKGNISCFIGQFYSKDDPNRQAGFTLVYAGINIGSLLAIAGVGYIQKYEGWQACFGIASLILILGLSLFRSSYGYFARHGLPPDSCFMTLSDYIKKKPAVFLWFLIAFIVIYFCIKKTLLGDSSLYVFGLLFCFYLAKIIKKYDFNTRRKLFAIIFLFGIAIFYKAMFFETYMAINVFTDRLVNRNLFGHDIPAAVFLSLGSLFSIILGPLFANFWKSTRFSFSIPFKFGLSLLIMGIAIQFLATSITIANNHLIPSFVLILFRFIFVLSELFILPIGLSVVTEFSPSECVGLMTGCWYLTAAFGGKLAGIFAYYAAVPKSESNIHHLLAIYHHAFQFYALINFLMFFICWLAIPWVNNLLENKPYNKCFDIKI